MSSRRAIFLLALLAALGLSATATAQPHPPVPAEYLREERGGLHFAYHPSARDGVRPLLEQAESVRAELRRAFGADILDQVSVRVAWGQTDLSRHQQVPRDATAMAAAVQADANRHGAGQQGLDALGRRVPLLAMDLEEATRQGADGPTDAFRREMAVHALGELGGARRLPGWLTTGFGASFAGSADLQERLGLGWALSRNRLIPVQGLDVALTRGGIDAKLSAAEAADWVSFLRTRPDCVGVADLVRRLGGGESVEAAVRASFGRSLGELESEWRTDLGRRAVFVPLLVGGLAFAALVLGAAAGWRRTRKRRAARAAEEERLRRLAREQTPQMQMMPVHVRLVRLDGDEPPFAAALQLGAREELGDPDVPKIAHGDQWHTLH